MLTQHLEKLVHFVGVVQAGSIRKYAVERKIAQPAVSKSIQILETQLQCSLLTRNQHGVNLTHEGEKLFKWARTVISEATDLDQSIRAEGSFKIRADLTMGAYYSIAIYFLPKFFEFLRVEQPSLRLQLIGGTSDQLVADLKMDKLDFIISVDPPESRDICRIKLFDDSYAWYIKRGNVLENEQQLLFSVPDAKDSSGKTIFLHLRSLPHGVDRLVACGDFEIAKAMVEAGTGTAILPQRVANPLVQIGKLEQIEGRKYRPFGAHAIYFSCRSHRSSDACLAWIARQLKAMLPT